MKKKNKKEINKDLDLLFNNFNNKLVVIKN